MDVSCYCYCCYGLDALITSFKLSFRKVKWLAQYHYLLVELDFILGGGEKTPAWIWPRILTLQQYDGSDSWTPWKSLLFWNLVGDSDDYRTLSSCDISETVVDCCVCPPTCTCVLQVCMCVWVNMQAFFPIPLNFWNIFKGAALIEILVKLETKHCMRNQKMGLWESSSQILSEKKEFTSLCGDDQGSRCLGEDSVLFSPGKYNEQIPLLIWVEHITWVRDNSHLC